MEEFHEFMIASVRCTRAPPVLQMVRGRPPGEPAAPSRYLCGASGDGRFGLVVGGEVAVVVVVVVRVGVPRRLGSAGVCSSVVSAVGLLAAATVALL